MSIEEKFAQFISFETELVALRKKTSEIKKAKDKLEVEIKEYMKNNELDSISINNAQIVLYDKKISKTFSKEAIVENLKEQLNGDENKAEALADSILKNKTFNTEPKVKAVIKKKTG